MNKHALFARTPSCGYFSVNSTTVITTGIRIMAAAAEAVPATQSAAEMEPEIIVPFPLPQDGSPEQLQAWREACVRALLGRQVWRRVCVGCGLGGAFAHPSRGQVRVALSDGRELTGSFHCFDCYGNLIVNDSSQRDAGQRA